MQGHTHTDGVKFTSADLFSVFHDPKILQTFDFLLYETNRLHFSVRMYCNRSQMTSRRVKNNHATRHCLHAVTSSVIDYSTHARENVIYLLNTLDER